MDVGQGDCTVAIDYEARAAILVDCPDGGGAVALQHLDREGIQRIDTLFLTHLHDDHFGDALTVARSTEVGEVRLNLGRRVPESAAGRSKLLAALRGFAALEDDGISTNHTAHRGDSGATGLLRWIVLWPPYGKVLAAVASGNPNRASVVLRLEAADRRFLIGGDAVGKDWCELVDAEEDIRADVFLVPHHGGWLPPGAGQLSMPELLDAIEATHHVVSVGTRNTYGHPHPETLTALGERADRARVTCTEVNTTCLAGHNLPRAEAARLPAGSLVGVGLQRDESSPCAGTVRFEFDGKWTSYPSEDQHAEVINKLGAPQCRCRLASGETGEPDPSEVHEGAS